MRPKRTLLDCAREVAEHLGRVYTAEGVAIWLLNPHADFGGRSPADLWAAGHYERVVQVARRAAEGEVS